MTLDRRSALKALGAAGAALAAAPAKGATQEHSASAPSDAVGLLYDATRCCGCQACVAACRRANRLGPPDPGAPHAYSDDLAWHTANIIQRYAEGDLDSYIKRQCMHCIDPACASACMLGAFQKREHGVVTWDADLCIGCRYCQVACPFNVPAFEWEAAFPRLVKCQLCLVRAGDGEPGPLAEGKEPACCEACPRDAVVFGKRAELLEEAHRRLDADPGRYEPKVYGEEDAGGTQVLYLSAAGIPFEKLGLPDLGPESIPSLPENLQHTLYQGFVAPAALYAILGVVVWRNRRRQEEGKAPGEVEPPGGGEASPRDEAHAGREEAHAGREEAHAGREEVPR